MVYFDFGCKDNTFFWNGQENMRILFYLTKKHIKYLCMCIFCSIFRHAALTTSIPPNVQSHPAGYTQSLFFSRHYVPTLFTTK